MSGFGGFGFGGGGGGSSTLPAAAFPAAFTNINLSMNTANVYFLVVDPDTVHPTDGGLISNPTAKFYLSKDEAWHTNEQGLLVNAAGYFMVTGSTVNNGTTARRGLEYDTAGNSSYGSSIRTVFNDLHRVIPGTGREKSVLLSEVLQINIVDDIETSGTMAGASQGIQVTSGTPTLSTICDTMWDIGWTVQPQAQSGLNNISGAIAIVTADDASEWIDDSTFVLRDKSGNPVIDLPFRLIFNSAQTKSISFESGTIQGVWALAGVINQTVNYQDDSLGLTYNMQSSHTGSFTLTGNRTLAAPTNPVDGARLCLLINQDATGGRTLAFNSVFLFPPEVSQYVNPTASATTIFTAVYSNITSKWHVTGMHRNLPLIATLTDAATIAVDASLSNCFKVTLGGNRTLGAPTNPVDGQKILIRVRQDATGSRTLAYNAIYRFGTDVTSPTLSTAVNKTDFLGFVYNLADTKWDCVSVAKGY